LQRRWFCLDPNTKLGLGALGPRGLRLDALRLRDLRLRGFQLRFGLKPILHVAAGDPPALSNIA